MTSVQSTARLTGLLMASMISQSFGASTLPPREVLPPERNHTSPAVEARVSKALWVAHRFFDTEVKYGAPVQVIRASQAQLRLFLSMTGTALEEIKDASTAEKLQIIAKTATICFPVSEKKKVDFLSLRIASREISSSDRALLFVLAGMVGNLPITYFEPLTNGALPPFVGVKEQPRILYWDTEPSILSVKNPHLSGESIIARHLGRTIEGPHDVYDFVSLPRTVDLLVAAHEATLATNVGLFRMGAIAGASIIEKATEKKSQGTRELCHEVARLLGTTDSQVSLIIKDLDRVYEAAVKIDPSWLPAYQWRHVPSSLKDIASLLIEEKASEITRLLMMQRQAALNIKKESGFQVSIGVSAPFLSDPFCWRVETPQGPAFFTSVVRCRVQRERSPAKLILDLLQKDGTLGSFEVDASGAVTAPLGYKTVNKLRVY